MTLGSTQQMPNLPENFDPKDWEICLSPITPEDQGFIQETRNLWVKHIPTGTKSRTIRLSGQVFRNPDAGKAIMQQKVNRLILEVFPIIDPKRSSFYDWLHDDQSSNSKISTPKEGDTRVNIYTKKTYVYDGAQWFPLENQNPDLKPLLNLPAPRKISLTRRPKTPEPRPIPKQTPRPPPVHNNTASSHKKRKFNLD